MLEEHNFFSYNKIIFKKNYKVYYKISLFIFHISTFFFDGINFYNTAYVINPNNDDIITTDIIIQLYP